jgi:carboxypeptidase C (cathepsin A)
LFQIHVLLPSMTRLAPSPKWMRAPAIGVLLSLAAAWPVAAVEPPASDAAHAKATPKATQQSDPSGQAPEAAQNALPAAVTTSHTLELPGRNLRFKAIASAIRLSDAESLAPKADIATLAFVLEGADAAKRPITFAINGGPGAASAWLNLGALGPWRLPLDPASPAPSALPVTIDNSDTWLDFTDLVFIDPPGTGYSRILAKGDDTRRHFYSVNGDIDVLAVTIRKWLVANKRLASPKFIVGESYGGFRVPKLARRLQDEEGIGIKGLVLISPVLDFGWFEGVNNPLSFATRLPSQAAAKGLAGPGGRDALSEVEAYAAGPYLADLLRGERDPDALARITEKVAEFTGLDPELVRMLGGRIDMATFARERTRAGAKITSLYDARVSGFDPSPHAASSEYSDPILDAIKTPLASAMADLIGNRLGWPVEARYEILNEDVNHAWDWGKGREPAEALSDLKRAMALDPSLRVLVAHGVTDQVTPYFASKLLIDQVPPMGDPDRLRLRVYGGGHMLYLDDRSRAGLRDDAKKLIEGK